VAVEGEAVGEEGDGEELFDDKDDDSSEVKEEEY